MAKIRDNLLAVAQISMASAYTGEEYGQATGFLINKSQKFFLVTNWHVLTGRHYKKKTIYPEGAPIPRKLIVHLNAKSISGEAGFTITRKRFEVKLSVTDDIVDDTGYVHPDYGSEVDVVSIPVTEQISEISSGEIDVVAFDYFPSQEELEDVMVMHPVVIPGFPLLRITPPNSLPIVKTAFLASEPQYTPYSKYFFVNGKTKRGWSGAPILVNPAAFKPINACKKGGNFSNESILFGVYSGRDESDPELHTLELGLAWPLHSCILPIIENQLERE